MTTHSVPILDTPCATDIFCFLCLGPVRQEGQANVLVIGSGDPRHILKTIAGLQNEESLHVSLSLLNYHVATK